MSYELRVNVGSPSGWKMGFPGACRTVGNLRQLIPTTMVILGL